MEEIPHHPLIQITQESVRKVRQLYEIDDVIRIKESLNIIQDWLEKQPHLANAAEYINYGVIERLFVIEEGSIERTKIRLDKLFTCRRMIPDLTLHRSMEEFESHTDEVLYVPLPKLHPTEQSRVMVTQFLTEKLDASSLLIYFRYCYMVGEYRVNFDYCIGERYIIDMKNIHVGLFSRVNPFDMKKAEILCTDGYGTKVKGIHLLNASTFFDKLIGILKPVIKKKVANRIHVHHSFEDLHKHVPKEILPKEYGGDEESCKTLNEKWLKLLGEKEATQIIRNFDNLVSDESKRPASEFNEEYMGMPGSFRTLTVD